MKASSELSRKPTSSLTKKRNHIQCGFSFHSTSQIDEMIDLSSFNNTMKTVLKHRGDKFSPPTHTSPLGVKALTAFSPIISALLQIPLLCRYTLFSPSAVKTWPLPHSSSLTPTQDLSHCCFHDNTNAETAGWDAQQDKAYRYQGEGCTMSRKHSQHVMDR